MAQKNVSNEDLKQKLKNEYDNLDEKTKKCYDQCKHLNGEEFIKCFKECHLIDINIKKVG